MNHPGSSGRSAAAIRRERAPQEVAALPGTESALEFRRAASRASTACAVLFLLAAAARAQQAEVPAKGDEAGSAAANAVGADGAANEEGPRPLLMEGLDRLGAGRALRAWRLDFAGWLEQSYSANTQQPENNSNTLHAFDDRSNAYRFNQFVVTAQRALAEGKGFDMGGRVELLYGSDGRLIHAAGLRPGDTNDTLQFDPVEFYFTLRLPVGEGLTVKAGKFVTPIGSEVIDAPANALYTHSFLFAVGTPLTHAGVSLSYPLSERTSIAYSLVRGWDVWIDNNEALSHILTTNWKSGDEKLALVGNLMYGPEQKDNESHDRTLLDLIASYNWSDRFSTSLNGDFANEENAAPDGGDARWWGVATYATWKQDARLSYSVRAEYFVDRDGSRTGFTADLAEVTAGVTFFPFAATRNVRLRPEVRWDHAFGDNPFDDGTRSDQFTCAVDLILSF